MYIYICIYIYVCMYMYVYVPQYKRIRRTFNKRYMGMKRNWTTSLRLSLLVLYRSLLLGGWDRCMCRGCKLRSSPAATPAAPEVWTFMSLGTAHAYRKFLLKPARQKTTIESGNPHRVWKSFWILFFKASTCWFSVRWIGRTICWGALL